MNSLLDLHTEVAAALAAARPVVALESTIISHGMPWPQNAETALAVEDEVRKHGAVPATIAIVDGRLKAGLSRDRIEQLARAGPEAAKVSRRDIPIVVARYTLLQLDSEHLSALPHLYKSRNFVTLQTFEPVASLFRTPFMVAVASDSKWKSMTDLLAAVKAKPGRVTYGSWGVGSPGHLGAEQLELASSLEMQHVPFREVSQLFTSVGSGDVGWSFGSIPSSQGPYKAGKLRYIAIAAAKRVPQLPDVPTVAEAGGPAGFEVSSFVVLVAPKGIPATVRGKINADVAKAIAEPDVKARFDTFAFEPIAWSPEEIGRNAQTKSKVYEQLVKRKNISLE